MSDQTSTTSDATVTTSGTHKLSGGAIAGIVIVVIIVLAVIGFLIYWFAFRKKPVSTFSSWKSPKTMNASEGEQLNSPNGAYFLLFQHDGNLVFYSKGTVGSGDKPLWASGTSGNPSAYFDFTSNGNLYIYSDPTKSTIIYSNTTVNGSNGPYELRVDNSGIFYEADKSGKPVYQFYPSSP